MYRAGGPWRNFSSSGPSCVLDVPVVLCKTGLYVDEKGTYCLLDNTLCTMLCSVRLCPLPVQLQL